MVPKISKREFDCLRMTNEGKKVHEIAVSLGIHQNSVRTYLSRLKEKLQACDIKDVITKSKSLELI